jgi:chloramphenicol O-acetyltransferase
MRKYLVPIFFLFFFSASAQMTKDDVNLIQAIYGKDKRDLMQAYMQFKDTASEHGFWKLYDKYEADRKKLGQNYISILQNYADNYEKLDDKKADVLINKALANNLAFENLYMQYYKRMKPVVGALKASQFLQLETYLRNVVKLKISNEIPFIGQIDKTKVAN